MSSRVKLAVHLTRAKYDQISSFFFFQAEDREKHESDMKMRKEIHDHMMHMVKFFLHPHKRSLTTTGLSVRQWQE